MSSLVCCFYFILRDYEHFFKFFDLTSSQNVVVLSRLTKIKTIYILRKGKGVGGIAKYLLFLTGVGGWFWITLM